VRGSIVAAATTARPSSTNDLIFASEILEFCFLFWSLPIPPKWLLGCQAASRAHPLMSKRARRSPAPASDPEATSAHLVARLSRDDLEHLVVHSLDTGVPVSRSTVLSCLPESLQSATVQPTVIIGTSRTGTGLFDFIDDDLLVPEILMRLPFSKRFSCVSSVRKACTSCAGAPRSGASSRSAPRA
jgi:hypothetical protein